MNQARKLNDYQVLMLFRAKKCTSYALVLAMSVNSCFEDVPLWNNYCSSKHPNTNVFSLMYLMLLQQVSSFTDTLSQEVTNSMNTSMAMQIQ